MKPSNHYKIKVEHPSGEWDTYQVPRFFDMNEVARHLSHSEIWLHVPKGWNISKFVQPGPFWAHWDHETRDYDMVQTFEPIALNA